MDLMYCFKQFANDYTGQLIICDLNHTILYMNPKACRDYEAAGGINLVGTNLTQFHRPETGIMIAKVLDWFAADSSHNSVFIGHNPARNADNYMAALRDESGNLIGYYERQENRTCEKTMYEGMAL